MTLSVTANDGNEVLRLHKRWFRYAVMVSGAMARRWATSPSACVWARRRSRSTGPAGEVVGELRSENWRARDFRFDDAAGVEVARVTKQWRGLATEVFTDADSYAVTFAPSTDDRLRASRARRRAGG